MIEYVKRVRMDGGQHSPSPPTPTPSPTPTPPQKPSPLEGG